jgi:hypothetical protein
MTELGEFFLHTLGGRVLLLSLLLVVSLLVATLAGWLPALG